jgi:hypothetical protein
MVGEFAERFASLEAELALMQDDRGWLRQATSDTDEFTKEGIDQIAALSRIFNIKNPLIQRGIEVKKDYVWGQGVSISAKQPEINVVIQAFLDDLKNKAELTSHEAMMVREVERQTDGNIFFVLFTNQTNGRVQLRSIPLGEIVEVICNPDDAKDVWYYHRKWTSKGLQGTLTTNERLYPDWRHRPTARPGTVEGVRVEWDAPIRHLKSGGYSDWKFGISDVYAALAWAKAYTRFLEDGATIRAALARFAFKVKTAGGARGVAAAKTRLNTTLGGTSGRETNPPPAAGSTFIASETADMEPIKTAGATASMDDGRRMLLMVAAGQGLPETFYGDSQSGSLATARSLDRPTELMMTNIQRLWKAVIGDILSYVIYWAVRAPSGKLRSLGLLSEDEDGEDVIMWSNDPVTNEPYNPTVDIDFPPVVEIDPKASVEAVQIAAPFIPDERLIARLMMTALGVSNADELLTAMFDEQNQLDQGVKEAARQVRAALIEAYHAEP